MKSLNEYIKEAKINEGQATPEIKEKIKELEEIAKEKDLTIKFRDCKMDSGDFCIFIYAPHQRRYMVGFDGSWESKDYNFEICYNQAKDWIEGYDKNKKTTTWKPE